jgi:hypothetical protein
MEVRPDLLSDTDLASVPTFLGWFARRHGRHTPAALLHDQLITSDPSALPANQQMPDAQADLLFRQALAACDVALVKSWVLWTGVTLRTRNAMRPWGRLAIIAWFVAALAGTAVLVAGAATGNLLAVALALVAPIPFAALWGRQWSAGLIAGYAFWPIASGSLPAWLAYQAYRLAEYAVLGVRRLLPRNRGTGLEIPAPVPYGKR